MNNLSCAVACISTSVMDMFIVANIDRFCSTEKLIIYTSFLLDFFLCNKAMPIFFCFASVSVSGSIYPKYWGSFILITKLTLKSKQDTVMPTKSVSDVIFCLQLFSKTLTCTLHLSLHESRDHLCFNPILWIGLIHT